MLQATRKRHLELLFAKAWIAVSQASTTEIGTSSATFERGSQLEARTRQVDVDQLPSIQPCNKFLIRLWI